MNVMVPGESKQEVSVIRSLVIFPSLFLLVHPN